MLLALAMRGGVLAVGGRRGRETEIDRARVSGLAVFGVETGVHGADWDEEVGNGKESVFGAAGKERRDGGVNGVDVNGEEMDDWRRWLALSLSVRFLS